MAMRKVIIGPEGIMLKHVLRMYDKESLLNYARDLEIRRTSGLKKDELAEKIANELLMPTVMRRRIAVLSPECRTLLERAIRGPFVPASEEMEDALALHESDYAFLNKRDQLDVPVDVKRAYEKLNTQEFRKYARKMSWLSQCLDFGRAFYGIFDKDVLRKMFNMRKGFHISEEELEKLCNEFPADMTECHLEEGQRFIVVEYLAYDDRYKDLLDIQADKDFYIPNDQEVLDYAKNLYLSKEPAYQKFKEFLQHEIGMTYDEADEEALEIWDKVQFNIDFSDIIQYLIDVYEDFLDDTKIEEMIQLLQELNNNTRMQIHRGHTPNEMMKKGMEEGGFSQRPIVVPGSMEAANLLKCASEELREMGISVDLDSNAAIIPNNFSQNNVSGQADNSFKKIYPNDPCPCGSGKKFKKCCGRHDKL
ncbi:MAG: SEC-C domain-containing protein [Lachnospiraceae bacterium]|nr:SEC-C domain-containing protein [Lachnospiraceae bacterium]